MVFEAGENGADDGAEKVGKTWSEGDTARGRGSAQVEVLRVIQTHAREARPMIPPLLFVVVAVLDCSLVPASSTSWTMYSLSFCSFSCVLFLANSRTVRRGRAGLAVFARQVGGGDGDSHTGSRASAARLR